MFRATCIVGSLLASSTYASPQKFKLLEPRDVYIDLYENETVHDPYVAPIDKYLKYGATFNLDFTVIRYDDLSLFWLNKLHFDQASNSGHIKHAGWQYEIGAPIYQDDKGSRIELFKQHHSRHVLEEERNVHFPVYDRIGIRLRMIPYF